MSLLANASMALTLSTVNTVSTIVMVHVALRTRQDSHGYPASVVTMQGSVWVPHSLCSEAAAAAV